MSSVDAQASPAKPADDARKPDMHRRPHPGGPHLAGWRSATWRAIAALAGALLVAAAFPPAGKPCLLIFGFALFLPSLRSASPRAGLCLGVLFGFTLFAVSLFWMRIIFGLAAVSLWAIATLFPAAFGLLYTSSCGADGASARPACLPLRCSAWPACGQASARGACMTDRLHLNCGRLVSYEQWRPQPWRIGIQPSGVLACRSNASVL
jgi:hypothetical protein